MYVFEHANVYDYLWNLVFLCFLKLAWFVIWNFDPSSVSFLLTIEILFRLN